MLSPSPYPSPPRPKTKAVKNSKGPIGTGHAQSVCQETHKTSIGWAILLLGNKFDILAQFDDKKVVF